MLLIGVLIGVSLVMLWTKGGVRGEERERSTAERIETTETSDVPAESIAPSSAALPLPPAIPDNTRTGLSVADQAAGRVVFVTGLSVTEKKWVAIYDDQGGKPGWILGARRVHAGDRETSVELLRATLSGAVYYVAILNDDGDDEFNRLTDLPPLSPDKVTVVRFKAQ